MPSACWGKAGVRREATGHGGGRGLSAPMEAVGAAQTPHGRSRYLKITLFTDAIPLSPEKTEGCTAQDVLPATPRTRPARGWGHAGGQRKCSPMPPSATRQQGDSGHPAGAEDAAPTADEGRADVRRKTARSAAPCSGEAQAPPRVTAHAPRAQPHAVLSTRQRCGRCADRPAVGGTGSPGTPPPRTPTETPGGPAPPLSGVYRSPWPPGRRG